MLQPERLEPLAVKIRTVARLLESSPAEVRDMVRVGNLPAPFRLKPGGPELWFVPELKERLAKRSRQAIAA
jgi:hypothetical protein